MPPVCVTPQQDSSKGSTNSGRPDSVHSEPKSGQSFDRPPFKVLMMTRRHVSARGKSGSCVGVFRDKGLGLGLWDLGLRV